MPFSRLRVPGGYPLCRRLIDRFPELSAEEYMEDSQLGDDLQVRALLSSTVRELRGLFAAVSVSFPRARVFAACA